MDLKIKITNKNIYKSNYNFNKFKDKRDSKTLLRIKMVICLIYCEEALTKQRKGKSLLYLLKFDRWKYWKHKKSNSNQTGNKVQCINIKKLTTSTPSNKLKWSNFQSSIVCCFIVLLLSFNMCCYFLNDNVNPFR
jgi:hypothetical protein